MQQTLKQLINGDDLSREQMTEAMDTIMEGQATAAQIGAFLTALRIKGETVDEVAGGAASMRRHAAFIDSGARTVVDTCGTGGDGGSTFNISTTAAFVVAGADVCVAKHGNRAVSSQCGSADVLRQLGVNIDADPDVMEQCLQEHGIGFLFAPTMHPAMKHAAGPRREIGFRTVFNMLGPLTNPAAATGQVIGVFDEKLTEMFAAVLSELGSRRAFIVHGSDGMDEITVFGPSRVSELRDGRVRTYQLHPEMLIEELDDQGDIQGGDAEHNAHLLKQVLEGAPGTARQIVVLNAAAAIAAGEKADSLEEGIKLAEESIDSGEALKKLELLIENSQA